MAKGLERDREQTEENIPLWIQWGNLEMDHNWRAGSPTMNWIWEFNNKMIRDHCLITCLVQLLSCLFFPKSDMNLNFFS